MDAQLIHRISTHPDFVELESRRTRFAWVLTVIMLAIYYGFILIIAFAPAIMAIKVGTVMTLGFPLGIGVIVSAIVLTGLYVWRANADFDPLTHRVVEGVK
jgi:uncharacterized membrane protein (DUF485 family)